MSITTTLRNDFHNTEAVVRVPADGILSHRQTQRAHRALCGISDCRCGGIYRSKGVIAWQDQSGRQVAKLERNDG